MNLEKEEQVKNAQEKLGGGERPQEEVQETVVSEIESEDNESVGSDSTITTRSSQRRKRTREEVVRPSKTKTVTLASGAAKAKPKTKGKGRRSIFKKSVRQSIHQSIIGVCNWSGFFLQ